MVGIIIVLVLCGLFIFVGVVIIENFLLIFYIFGVFFIWMVIC